MVVTPTEVIPVVETEEETTPKVPEPALIRGAILAVVALVGAVTGKVLDLSWVEPVLGVYAVAAPVVLSWWIRRNVTPTPKGRHAQ